MTDDGGVTEWLKWIAGGIIVFLGAFWQWIERKLERMGDRIDALRESTRSDRHDLATDVHKVTDGIEEDLKDHATRLTKLEKNGK